MAKQIKQEDLMVRRKKELAILRAQNELLEQAKENVIEHYQDSPERLKQYTEEIEYAQNENIQKGMQLYGAKKSEIDKSTYGTADAAGIAEYNEHLKKRGIEDDSVLYKKDITDETDNVTLSYGKKESDDSDDFHFEKVEMPEISVPTVNEEPKFTYNTTSAPSIQTTPQIVQTTSNDSEWKMPKNGSFDLLPLPSNGECYPHKKDRIAVRELNASDENAITSSNLYRGGKVLDVILKRTICDNNINPDDLISGDRDMILLWLRATGYGVNFPIQVRDPQTGKIFDSKIDLSQIKTKEFKLKGDENGCFDYQTGNGDLIKFKYLTHREEVAFDKNYTMKKAIYKKGVLTDLYNDLMDEYDSITDMNENNKKNIYKAINLIKEWCDSIPEDKEDDFTYDETLTDLMIAKTVSVNGNTDRNFIRDYILTMRAGESRRYRIYMEKNEPGMDFEITVNRPESLGGGSFNTFLSLDSLIFLSVSDV